MRSTLNWAVFLAFTTVVLCVQATITVTAYGPIEKGEKKLGDLDLQTGTKNGTWVLLNGKFYHPDAYYYIISPGKPAGCSCAGGSQKTLLFWEPFGNGDMAVVYQSAAQDLIQSKKTPLCVKIVSVGWGSVASDPMCVPGAKGCPGLLFLGTTQLGGRVKRNEAKPLQTYLEATTNQYGALLTDDLIKFYFYDYSFAGQWMGVPLVTDTRIVYYNKTTFASLELKRPPPDGDWGSPYVVNWNWTSFTDTVLTIKEKTGNYGLTLRNSWDEEFKLTMAIAGNYRAKLYVQGRDGRKRCGVNTP